MSAGPIIIILSKGTVHEKQVMVHGLRPDANRFAVAWTLACALIKKLVYGAACNEH